MNKMTTLIALAFLLGSTTAAKASIDPKTVDAINAAIKAVEKATGQGGEWRDTWKIIGKAKAAARKGDTSKAIELANKAKRQGDLGYKQSIVQKKAKPPAYLR